MVKTLKPNSDSIQECVSALEEGLAIIYPTETVYGLGVDATNRLAVSNLFKIKERDPSEPLSLAVASVEKARELAEFSETASLLADKFLPGPLTLVLKAKRSMPLITANGRIGIRIPSNEFALELLQRYSKPITATSANISGMHPATDAGKVSRLILGRVAIFVDAEKTEYGKESSVVEVFGNEFKLLREGAIKMKAIENVLKIKIR